MHTELEQKCMLRKKTQAFRGKIKLYGEKTQGKAEKLKEKLKKLKEKLKNSLSGKALLWYMPKIRRKKTPGLRGLFRLFSG